ncbi:hypothetical protein HUE56_17715 [Azospirillum oryzae]|uniref:Uncharacterized protein n=2 Tax=Azospirillum TaxID=191 RepID=A0A6N1AHL8_9PROT|nr:hypothetical protein [Azospirillum oryzae]KAA0590952.1 hypothetical protein FZ938_02305 [Azospirillum oryzae]QKS50689.1 hypothetical protein HUE56_17715 [Azospirillum oryzae]
MRISAGFRRPGRVQDEDGMGWQIIVAAMAGYLALLGRSAWKQGEFRQFLRSLAIVAALCALLAGAVALAMLLDRT